MSQRTEERIFGQAGLDRHERLCRAYKTGEFVDQFTTAKDERTVDEILDREPKCVVAHRLKEEARKKAENKENP